MFLLRQISQSLKLSKFGLEFFFSERVPTAAITSRAASATTSSCFHLFYFGSHICLSVLIGAACENRTRLTSLEGWDTTNMPTPRCVCNYICLAVCVQIFWLSGALDQLRTDVYGLRNRYSSN